MNLINRTTGSLRSRLVRRGLLAAAVATMAVGAAAPSAQAELLSVFEAESSSTQAGAYADMRTNFDAADFVNNPLKELRFKLPPGVLGMISNFEPCPLVDFFEGSGTCSEESRVGTATVSLNIGSPENPFVQPIPLREVHVLKAGRGDTALLGVIVAGRTRSMIRINVRPDDYGLDATVEAFPNNVRGVDLTLWGVPWDNWGAATKARTKRLPFMANPARCGEEDTTTVDVEGYGNQGVWERFTATTPAQVGCEDLEFEPSVSVTPEKPFQSEPSGLTVGIDVPQNEDPDRLATPPIKNVSVTLPEGVSINPSMANGLEACTDAQLDAGTHDRSTCPVASQIGTAEFQVPALLDPEVTGRVYVGQPLPGNTYRLFIEAYGSSMRVKLKGVVKPDPVTGQLTTTFENNPQAPVEKIRLHLKGGPRAALAMPDSCGVKNATATLDTWTGLDQHRVNLTGPFTISANAQGGPCLPKGFAPGFNAGVQNAVAAASSPFNLLVAREDRTKELKAIKSVRLPEGLLGRVASVPLCGEAQAAAGTCPESSRVGHVQAALGAGSSPLWVPQAGKEPTAVYLAGPYRGAPYSLAIVVPAQAGPFNLGRVVVRSALHVDERTAAITTGVDETRLIDTDGTVTEVLPEALPRILKGIVLNQREIRVIMDREGFMVNPTDCSQKEITAEIYSVDGDRADVGNRFRVADCALLGFKPKFRARILDKGRRSTLRSFHPRTKFTVLPRKGDANIGGARVVLPSSTLLDQANIGTTCTRAQMSERKCPEKSIVGYAKAWSPLLRDVVEGPVYLAANGGARPLPDLAAVLDGEIRVVLQGEVSTLRTGGKARLQNTFRVVPDAPVERFELTMRGGKKTGLLVNSTDLCRTSERGVAVFTGQNNRRSRSALRLTPSFKGCRKVRRQAARKAAARKVAARKAARRKVTRR